MSRCTSLRGQPSMDRDFSNSKVLNNLTSCNGMSSNIIRGNQFIVLDEQSESTGTYVISPNNLSTIVKFSAPLQNNTTIQFIMNNSNALVGDEMLWMIDTTLVQTLMINVPVSSFYFTTCGELSEVVNSDDFDSYVFVLPWIFDGQSWISTWDSC